MSRHQEQREWERRTSWTLVSMVIVATCALLYFGGDILDMRNAAASRRGSWVPWILFTSVMLCFVAGGLAPVLSNRLSVRAREVVSFALTCLGVTGVCALLLALVVLG